MNKTDKFDEYMEGREGNSKDNKDKRPQYGKKGTRPRNARPNRGACDLDKIHTNAIEYWNKTKSFGEVTKFNWDLVIGQPRAIDVPTSATGAAYTSYDGTLNPAQVMALNVHVGPGWASDVNDGVNRALAQVMAKIRSALSTSNIGFETADLAMLATSSSSIACLIAYAKKVMESVNEWKSNNYVYPRALMKAMGFRYEDVAFNINTYSAKLNSLIDMYNGMNIVDMYDIHDRQYAMMHSIFADEDSSLAQLYIFKPINYYLYDDTQSACLDTALDYGSFSTFNSFLNLIATAIQKWYSSSDLYQINGTLLRAFKDAPRQIIPHHEIGTTIEPVQDRAFLMQIMNATICSPKVDDTWVAYDITQDPTTQNYVIWKPYITKDAAGYIIREHAVLRIFEDDPTPEDAMEMTRLLNFADTTQEVTINGTQCYYLTNCGSEIVTSISVYSYDTVHDKIVESKLANNLIVVNLVSSYLETLRSIIAFGPFRYLPYFAIYTADPLDSNKAKLAGILGDMYNWMSYSRQDWNTLQFIAYQSLWMPKNI